MIKIEDIKVGLEFLLPCESIERTKRRIFLLCQYKERMLHVTD